MRVRQWCVRRGVHDLHSTPGVVHAAAALIAVVLVLGSASATLSANGPGHTYFVAPDGLATNSGSITQPLDLATALSAESPAKPGDTIWLRGGTYYGAFNSVLTGTAGAPIVVRQYPGERAIIDGGGVPASTLRVHGAHTWYWGLEVMSSDPARVFYERVDTDTPNRPGPGRRTGVEVFGPNTKFINMIVHDVRDGFVLRESAIDVEINGALTFFNGFVDAAGARGDGLLVQGRAGTRQIVDVISFANHSAGVNVNGESAHVEGVTSFNNGVGSLAGSAVMKADNLLVGAVGKPADDIAVVANNLYHMSGAVASNATLGYDHSHNGSLLMRDNIIAGGSVAMALEQWASPTMSGNTIYSDSEPRSATTVRVRPNRYERGRAHVTIFNWDHASAVAVDFSETGLAVGETFEIRDAQNYFGPPLLTATYTGMPIMVPLSNLPIGLPSGEMHFTPIHTAPEFGAFVVLNLSASSPVLSESIRTDATAAAPETPIADDLRIASTAALSIQTVTAPAATPTITPSGGTFTAPIDVVLATSTSGASIRYTVDGSVPGPTSPVYSGPVHLSQSTVLRAQAFVPTSTSLTLLWDANVEADLAGYEVSYGFAAESYTSKINVGKQTSYQFTQLDPGRTYYFAVRAYNVSGAFSPFSEEVASGMAPSAVAQASFTIQLPPPAAPLLSPNGGTFIGPISVTLSTATAGASIRYTLDGSTPGATSPVYSAPIVVSSSAVLKAQSVNSAGTSTVTQATFTIQYSGPPVSTPFIWPAGGTFAGPIGVYMSTATAGATIRYTLDGTAPGPASPIYSTPVLIDKTLVLRARAFKAGMTDSAIGQAAFTIQIPPPSAPIIAPNGGTYTGPVDVALSTITAGATIRYTLDGSTPGPLSPAYTGPVRVSASAVLKAVSFNAGGSSTVSQATFTIQAPSPTTVAAPVMTPPAGTFNAPITVTLASATAGATIRYTLNGSVPGPSSPIYSGPIAVNSSLPIRAQAFKSGMTDSPLVQANYTILNPVIPDTIAPAVSIVSPLSNALVSGIVTVTASVWDNVGVTGVRFFINGVQIGAEDTAAPFSIQWDTRVNVGTDITAVARDAAGNSSTAAKVTVRLGN